MIRSFVVALGVACALGACDSGTIGPAQETAAAPGDSAPAASPTLPGDIDRAFAGSRLPALILEDTRGNTLDLGNLDQPVLVNLWATWCVPCRVEMPALDTLAGEMDGQLRVLTISQDIRGAAVVDPFFAEQGFARLGTWLDPDNDLGAAFSDGGQLPITILFDAQGREIFRVAGAYEWDSEEAIAQLTQAL